MKLIRENGSDGRISCYVRTGPETTNTESGVRNAKEFDDYLPLYKQIFFEHGEVEAVVEIELVKISEKIKESELENGKTVEDMTSPKEEEKSDEDEGEQDKMFKVIIEKPEPHTVKLSRKN